MCNLNPRSGSPRGLRQGNAGCGTGEHTILAARHGARTLPGIDISRGPSRSPAARPPSTPSTLAFEVLDALRSQDARRVLRHAGRQRAVPRVRRRCPNRVRRRRARRSPSRRQASPHVLQRPSARRLVPLLGHRGRAARGTLASAGESIRELPTASRSTPASARLPPKPGWPTLSGWQPGNRTESDPVRRGDTVWPIGDMSVSRSHGQSGTLSPDNNLAPTGHPKVSPD